MTGPSPELLSKLPNNPVRTLAMDIDAMNDDSMISLASLKSIQSIQSIQSNKSSQSNGRKPRKPKNSEKNITLELDI